MLRSKIRIWTILMCTALVGGLAVVGSTASADAARRVEATDHALTGDVTVVDPIESTLTVRDDGGQLTTIVVTGDTSVIDGARTTKLADLRPGDRVVVDWDDRTGRNLASYLEVVEDAAHSSQAAAHATD